MPLDYFTLAELRAQPDLDSSAKFSDPALTEAGEFIQGVVERVCDTSFVPREVVETLDGTGREGLRVRTPWVLEVVSVVIAGVTTTGEEYFVDSGVIERRAIGSWSMLTWPLGRRNIKITYKAGYSATPPPDLKDAMLQGARYRALSRAAYSAQNDRALSLTNEYGNVQLASANDTNRPTGLPEVDSVIMSWAAKTNTITYP